MNSPRAERVALVTGANRGLGLAVAARLHRLGHRVIVTARDAGAAKLAAESLGEGARALPLDVTDHAMVRTAAELAGPVDILVNNAAIMLDGGVAPSAISMEMVERHLAVNLLGAWRVSQAFLPGMLVRGWGRIVMVSSGTGVFANGLFPGAPAYSMSKVALNALTVLLAAETRGTGVLVNAVNPGMVRTRMRPDAARSAEAGAEDVVGAAMLPGDGPNGMLLRQGRVSGW